MAIYRNAVLLPELIDTWFSMGTEQVKVLLHYVTMATLYCLFRKGCKSNRKTFVDNPTLMIQVNTSLIKSWKCSYNLKYFSNFSEETYVEIVRNFHNLQQRPSRCLSSRLTLTAANKNTKTWERRSIKIKKSLCVI